MDATLLSRLSTYSSDPTHLSLLIFPYSSVPTHLSLLICPYASVLTHLSLLICPYSSVLTHRSLLICPYSSVPTHLSLLICPLLICSFPRCHLSALSLQICYIICLSAQTDADPPHLKPALPSLVIFTNHFQFIKPFL